MLVFSVSCYSLTVIMASKHSGNESTSAEGKRLRESVMLEVEMDILKCCCEGQGVSNVACYLELSQSAMSTVPEGRGSFMINSSLFLGG